MPASDRVSTAVVTGAGSGIGRAAALAVSNAGWNVVLAGRREEALRSVAAEGREGAGFLVVLTDVTQAASVNALFERSVAHFGRVDLLFNNAGVSDPAGPFEEWTPEAWRRVVDTNLSGMFFCIQSAFGTMKAQSPQGGRIINNGSIASMTPRPNSMAYTATKHAVRGLTKAASLDGRPCNIAVGQIDVGNARTHMVAGSSGGSRQADGSMRVEDTMDVGIVGQSVLYMAILPLEANVLFHTVMATRMPFIGRG